MLSLISWLLFCYIAHCGHFSQITSISFKMWCSWGSHFFLFIYCTTSLYWSVRTSRWRYAFPGKDSTCSRLQQKLYTNVVDLLLSAGCAVTVFLWIICLFSPLCVWANMPHCVCLASVVFAVYSPVLCSCLQIPLWHFSMTQICWLLIRFRFI